MKRKYSYNLFPYLLCIVTIFYFNFISFFPIIRRKNIEKHIHTRLQWFLSVVGGNKGIPRFPAQIDTITAADTEKKKTEIKVKTNTPTSLRKQLFSRLLSKSSQEYLLTDVLKTRQLFYSIHHRGRELQMLAKFPLDFVRMGVFISPFLRWRIFCCFANQNGVENEWILFQ